MKHLQPSILYSLSCLAASSYVHAGKYIATLAASSSYSASSVDELLQGISVKGQMFEIDSFRGFIFDSDKATADQVQELLATDGTIYEDEKCSMADVALNATETTEGMAGTPPRWGLDRINQRNLPLDGRVDFGNAYGQNVDIYVVDSGIDIYNPDFQGRASWGVNFVDQNYYDCNGHGTHVAGIAMSKTYGVAKQAQAIAVKVLDCNGFGYWSNVILGVQYSVNQARFTGKKSVINISIQGNRFEPVNQAVNAAVDAGLYVAVAAGDVNTDACQVTPASASKAIAVGATTVQDKFASFSNYGACVAILAPGIDITSTYTNGGTAVLSGTSMASPFVAGVIAITLSHHDIASWNMKAHLDQTSSKNKISLIHPPPPATKNALLFFAPEYVCQPPYQKDYNSYCDGKKDYIICLGGNAWKYQVPLGYKCAQETLTSIILEKE